MLIVGLTGGIGCGKSTVTLLFSELAVPVIDADSISHQLVEPGNPALTELIKAFSDKILLPDGNLDRHRLREIVFSDKLQKQKLEAILHPLVFAEMQRQISHIEKPYCIASIPLLFETHKADFVNRVLVIDCPEEIQIDRVKHRDGLDSNRIKTIIDSQVSREYRLTHADDIIDNASASFSRLAEDVKKLHNFYLSISVPLG